MRVGIYLADFDRSRTDSHGILNYSLGLTRTVDMVLQQDEDLCVLASEGAAAELGELPNTSLTVLPTPRTVAGRLSLDHWSVARWLERERIDVAHFPKGFIPFRRVKARVVATIHDDIPIALARGSKEEVALRLKRQYFASILTRSLRLADRVIVTSKSTRSALAALPAGRRTQFRVTYEGLGVTADDPVPIQEREPRVVVFGSRLPHKQTDATIRLLLPLLRQRGLTLTVLGYLPPGLEEFRGNCLSSIGRTLTTTEVIEIVSHSRAVVFGSMHEGFGLPPVEAWAVGTPATALRVSAMAEILAGLPGLHGKLSQPDLSGALDEVLALDEGSIATVSRAVRTKYSWEGAAKRTCAVYRELA